MALSKIDVANMVTGAVPVANGGTALTSGFVNGSDPRPLSKPIIVNGDCAVAQRGNSEASVTTSSISTCDRMALGISNLGTWTVTQETLSSGNAYNAGFKKAFRIDCTTADSSPSSSDNLFMQYKIEGNDVQVFKKGTSSAETYTLAFWVKSNKTGTAQVTLIDADNSRQVGATYAISSADTWEHKVLNYPADTTGAFDIDSNKSLEIEWALDAGSDFTSGAVPSAWESSSNADRSVNDLALGDNTANDWAITGIQLEVGEFSSTTLPPFQFEDFGDNLARCQRYYNMLASGAILCTNGGYNERLGVGYFQGSSLFFFIRDLPVPLRANPTIETVSGTNYFNVSRDGGEDNCDDIIFYTSSPNIISMRVDGSTATGSQGDPGIISINNTAARVAVTAEL